MPKGSPTEDLDSDGILDLTSAPSDLGIGPKAYGISEAIFLLFYCFRLKHWLFLKIKCEILIRFRAALRLA